MDLKELIAFRTIVEEGTFSKAAAKLNYAQSTITNQIQRLEKQLGFALFQRGWDAELTAAGKIYAEEVQSLIRHWHYAEDLAKSLEKEEIGTVSIGAVEPAAATLLPGALRRLAVSKPAISCSVTVANTDALLQGVKDGKLDFAICGDHPLKNGLQFEQLYAEELSFIADDAHPLAGRTSLSLSDLLPYPLLAGGSNCLYHIRLDEELSFLPSRPLTHTVTQLSLLPSFVQGCNWVGATLASLPLPNGIQRLDVLLAEPEISIGILYQREPNYLSATKRSVIELIREQIGIRSTASG
ncbi:LysR family transcriptional regulator [Paenibacillus radicis (ex Gao et al. 2016)]|uniref:HTH-type transcriptional regulator YtlI n=1 Tax=Paenibacillus radicis (ex Gao et al. 2016) TaxID=1737354 RepID=A0A917GRG8_9BACL|nr:LysR family transcriptional regulator [Paenibacillus radicis (ex Gao et al. 2016)]GGG54763.1 HTH-type transcriptional regulator YtlI [Paenibacillus radicis (ex Gao et al. 2016)]